VRHPLKQIVAIAASSVLILAASNPISTDPSVGWQVLLGDSTLGIHKFIGVWVPISELQLEEPSPRNTLLMEAFSSVGKSPLRRELCLNWTYWWVMGRERENLSVSSKTPTMWLNQGWASVSSSAKAGKCCSQLITRIWLTPSISQDLRLESESNLNLSARQSL